MAAVRPSRASSGLTVLVSACCALGLTGLLAGSSSANQVKQTTPVGMVTDPFGVSPTASKHGATTRPSTRITPSSHSIENLENPSGADVQQARVQVDDQLREVDRLTREYQKHQQAAQTAATKLAQTSFAAAQAETAQDHALQQLRVSQVQQSAQIRSLYIDGPSSADLDLLGASSPQEALWQVTVGQKIQVQALHKTISDTNNNENLVGAADQAALVHQQTRDTLSLQLQALQDESAQAEAVLQQANQKLTDLKDQSNQLIRVKAAHDRLIAAQAQASAAPLGPTGPSGAIAIPAEYLASYQSAGNRCAGMRWTLLAAVGQVESGHGRNNGPSSAGAVGPMQFMPTTFASYAIDGNRDGRTDAWDYADAIPAAAAYLCASGAEQGPDGVSKALFAYNRAQWYVDLVLRTEQAIVNARR